MIMQTVMYTSTIFGPIHSRRLGTSLGVNLMPADGKICSFDCLYCEAGYNAQGPGKAGIPPRLEVARLLEEKLSEMEREGKPLDVITFSGNGEPTLHPDFEGVVDDTIRLRDRYYPSAKVSVLSNATRIGDEAVCRALRRVDNNILKLDSADPAIVTALDRPVDPGFDIAKVIDRLATFNGQAIVQTMLTRGEHEGRSIDNSDEASLDALIAAYRRIRPRSIMLYTIDRPTPEITLRKVSREELDAAAARIEKEIGIPVTVAD